MGDDQFKSGAMRIAIYSGAIPGTNFVELLVRQVASSGHQVLLYGTKRGTAQYRDLDVIKKSCPSGFLGTLFFVGPIFIKLLVFRYEHFKVLRSHISERASGPKHAVRLWARYAPVVWGRPDIFHLQWISSGSDWLFLRELGIHLIGSFRGTQLNVRPVVELDLADSYRHAFPQFSGFHAVSDAISRKAEKYGAPRARITVIRPAVDKALLADPLAILQPLEGRCLRLLSIGRNHWIKGFRYSLDACAELVRLGVNFRYTIVAGADCEAVAHQRDQLGLQGNVELLDSLPHNRALALYKDADLFILPSLEEGIANVVLEAMALGCPVLSSDCGGMEEVIKDGVNGLIFPVARTDVLLSQIQRFVTMPTHLIERLRENARETIPI